MNKLKRFTSLLLALLMLMPNVVLANDKNVVRLSGENRYKTAIRVSQEVYPNGSRNVILAGGFGEVDALTGTLLAAVKDAPLLLLDKYEHVEKQLSDLNAENVFILGGENVVSGDVLNKLKNAGYNVKRIAGSNRYETAAAVAKEAIGKADHVFLANDGLGGSLVDALAIGPVSGRDKKPILITGTNSVPEATLQAFKELEVKKVSIIGGTAVISDKVVKQLSANNISVESRTSGSNRYETAKSIADKYFLESDKAIIVNDGKINRSFIDAVVGGYFGAKYNAPILLTGGQSISLETQNYLYNNTNNAYVLGGSKAVADDILKIIEKTIKKEVTYPYLIKKVNNQKEFTDEYLEQVYKRTNPIIIDYYGNDITTHDDLNLLVRKLFDFRKNYQASRVDGIGYSSLVKNSDGSFRINFSMTYSDIAEEKFIDKEAARIKSEVIKSDMNDVEKAKAMHDYLITNMTYSYAYDTETSVHSAYTLFKEKRGVCSAFALAYSRLLDEVNIDNYYVVGLALVSRGWEGHAWNKLKIDGEWYNADVTWDLPSGYEDKDNLTNLTSSYRYFLKSDEKFYTNHKPDDVKLYPKSNNDNFDGYEYLDFFETQSENELSDKITKSLNNRENYINIKYYTNEKIERSYFSDLVFLAAASSGNLRGLIWSVSIQNEDKVKIDEPYIITMGFSYDNSED